MYRTVELNGKRREGIDKFGKVIAGVEFWREFRRGGDDGGCVMVPRSSIRAGW